MKKKQRLNRTHTGGPTLQVGEIFGADITNNEGLPTEKNIACTFQIVTLGEGPTPGTVQVGDGYNPVIDFSTQGTITIPEKVSYAGKEYKVTAIAAYAFVGCTSLESTGVEHNTTITKIGNDAFNGCTSLKSTGLESNTTITEIGWYAFLGCTGLMSTGLEHNTTITKLGRQAFSGCTSLGEIIFEVPTLPTMDVNVFSDSNVKVYYLEGVTNPEVLENQEAESVDSLTLHDIGIKTQPKTEYTAGEEFDGSGLVLTREYKISETENVKEVDLVYEVAKNEISFDKTVLTEADKEVMISYKGKNVSLVINVMTVDQPTKDPETPPTNDETVIPPTNEGTQTPPTSENIEIKPVAENKQSNSQTVVNTGDSTTLVSYGMMGMLGLVGMYKIRRSKKNI